jgi:gluconokinase
MVIIVMGVAGSGKSTIGSLLASRLGWQFIEGDQYHSPASVEKMRAGIPLTDADRQPWLNKLTTLIADWNTADENAVLTCSALKRAYREQLGLGHGIVYVYLKGSRGELEQRLRDRKSHFAGVELLESQLSTLEEPAKDEPAITVALSDTPGQIVDCVVRVLADKRNQHDR